LSHLYTVHASDPNFIVTCGIDGCYKTHMRFFLYQHIYRYVLYHKEARVIDSTRRTQGSIPVNLPVVVDDPEANNPADVLGDLPEGLHLHIICLCIYAYNYQCMC